MELDGVAIMSMKWAKSDKIKRYIEYRQKHYSHVSLTKPQVPLYIKKHGTSQEKVMKASPRSKKAVSLSQPKLPPAYDD
jgi:hypothetical protein